MNESTVQNTFRTSSLGTVDYSVFIATLCGSSGIGLYFAFFGKKKTTEEYLLGSREMTILPIAVSLIASQFSGISIMAYPAEIYSYGTQYWLTAPCYIFVILMINFVYIPVYFNNQVSNCYEYLEARFNKVVRKMVTSIFLLHYMLTLPVVIYIPSLAFAQATGINIHIINIVVSSVCIIYTGLGGIKAVVWTDVFQALITITSCITMMLFGINRVGGFGEVWRIADEGKRIEFFNMKLDLTTRHTFWNVCIGYTTMAMTFVGLNQTCVQRMVSLPSISKVLFRSSALVLYGIGAFTLITINCLMGIIAYSNYANCDPLKAGIISKSDQIVPYFVQDIVGNISGLPGLFMSCVFSAALSTMSATLNSLSAVIYYDFIKKFNIIKHTDTNAKSMIKVIVIVLGIYSITMGLVVDQFSHIFQVMMTVSGITHGTQFAIFFLGMLWPYCNSKGVITGTICGLITMVCIVLGGQYKVLTGSLKYPMIPTSVNGCDVMGIKITNLDQQTISVAEITSNNSFSVFNISFAWYTFLGAMITITVGIVGSYVTGGVDMETLHPRLFPPFLHSLLPDKIMKNNIELEVIDKMLAKKSDECQ